MSWSPNTIIAAAIREEAAPPDECTILVTGVPRGGTSMIAGALVDLGINMYHESEKNFENPAFAKLLREKQYDEAREIIATRNAVSKVWGVKHPQFVADSKGLLPMFRNPKIVVVLKDALSVANRIVSHPRYADGSYTFDDALKFVCNRMALISNAVHEAACPALLVSYDRAISEPERFVAALAEFVGAPQDFVRRAAEKMFENREHYLTRDTISVQPARVKITA